MKICDTMKKNQQDLCADVYIYVSNISIAQSLSIYIYTMHGEKHTNYYHFLNC